jgi:dTDP-4-amino-4,6-dideoxygalactose transaminase
MTTLAIRGGNPVRTEAWPNWPQSSPATLRNIEDVLSSHRWSISGQYRGTPSWEQRFGEAFAAYTGAAHCVPAANGTSSLTMALEACEVGAGDEVIVPGISWVASASAVLGINAIPVLTDIDPRTGCLDPRAAAEAITPKTRAITVVHLGSAVADLAALVELARERGIPLIEDCAQAHGARYRGRHVGLFGSAGTFSMQHSKLLTSGEGGAVITDDTGMARRLAHLRADGRTFSPQPPGMDEMELIETAEIMGNNYCLSEFHAAILVAQLEKLDAELEARRNNADYLGPKLAALGFEPQGTAEGTTARAHYTYVVRIPDAIVERVGLAKFSAALSAELGLPCKTMYASLNANRLYTPSSRRRFALGPEFERAVDPARFRLPAAEAYSRACIAMPHRMLLADRRAMDDIADAFEKVAVSIDALQATD